MMNTILNIMGYICLILFCLYSLKLITQTFLKDDDNGEKWFHIIMTGAAIGTYYLLKYAQTAIEDRVKYIILSCFLFCCVIGVTIALILIELRVREETKEIIDNMEEK